MRLISIPIALAVTSPLGFSLANASFSETDSDSGTSYDESRNLEPQNRASALEEQIDFSLNLSNCQEIAMNQNFKHVYKVFKPAEWLNFQEYGTYLGSADDIRDGFIHLAFYEQLDFVLNNFFAAEKSVYIAEFLVSDLGSDLKCEPGASGGVYPHLFDVPLKRKDVNSVEERILHKKSRKPT
jgi:uncharacterized protein (DUF952 family)